MLSSLRLSALLVLAACTSVAAHAQEAYTPIEQRFTAQQLRETGLDQLDAAQLQRLNALLRDEQTAQVAAVREDVAKNAQGNAESSTRGGLFSRDREPIVSKIEGAFSGWSSGTRFQLANGQTWRVIGTPEYYVPKSKTTSAPAVVLMPGLVGGWYLQVEGHGPRAKVQRVD